ncbi:hypothetical protein [Geobacter sp.]|uniref:hypothetical protein n=1 Tax=Geobacter sp. TaxID=46610 RepID=UPI0026257A2A|nr:hypothetical protein [Geobacter sp.]
MSRKKDLSIAPFKNESECLQINGLTIENRLDRVSLYGSLDITRDKEGLEKAAKLKEIVDSVVAAMTGEELPDKAEVEQPDTVKNPFA